MRLTRMNCQFTQIHRRSGTWSLHECTCQQIRSIFTFLHLENRMETRTNAKHKTTKIEEGRTGRTCWSRTCRTDTHSNEIDTRLLHIFAFVGTVCRKMLPLFSLLSPPHSVHATPHSAANSFEEIGNRPSRDYDQTKFQHTPQICCSMESHPSSVSH